MIQRIQSVYLLLTTLLSTLFLKGSYLTFIDNSGSTIRLMMTDLSKYTGSADTERIGAVWPLLVLWLIIPLLSMVVIFLFRKRHFQLLLSRILVILILSFIVASMVYSLTIISKYGATFSSWIKLTIPVLQLILSVLAYTGIKKDDDLVKSYDRLR